MADVTLAGRVAAQSRFNWKELRFARNWIYLVPALIFFVGYEVYPILRVLWISFTDYHYLRQGPANFVGLQNYANALADPLVSQGLLRALEFTAIFLPGLICVPLLLAILVDRVQTKWLSA